MWDVQTGGLIHTFTTQSRVNDIKISRSEVYIACGLSNGSVLLWDIHTKMEHKVQGNDQKIVTLCWLLHSELAVATRNSLYIYSAISHSTLGSLSFLDNVWGMIYLGDKKDKKDRDDMDDMEEDGEDGEDGEDREDREDREDGEDGEDVEGKGEGNGDKDRVDFLIGTSQPGVGLARRLYSFEAISRRWSEPPKQKWSTVKLGQQARQLILHRGKQSPTHLGQLIHPTLVGNDIACITQPSGMQLFSTESYNWANKPPLLDAAESAAVSLHRNLVVQTKDSIQIFSVDVLTSSEVQNDVRASHVYPLSENHIACLQPNRNVTLLEMGTLRELHPGKNNLLTWLSLTAHRLHSALPPSHRWLHAEFGASAVMKAWNSGTPLTGWTEAIDELEDTPFGGLSPECTWTVTVYGLPRQELCVKDTRSGALLAKVPLDDELGKGEIYDLSFNSETMFSLKIEGPGQHIQVPFDITASSSDRYRITKGKPVPLSEPREKPPYALDANCEWVIDSKSRKICWISPGNLRRGNGGHFWAGLSLVMVGVDGVVRKVTFKEPDC